MRKAKIVTDRCPCCNKAIKEGEEVIYLIATLTDLAAPHHAECIKEAMKAAARRKKA